LYRDTFCKKDLVVAYKLQQAVDAPAAEYTEQRAHKSQYCSEKQPMRTFPPFGYGWLKGIS